jgi:hypothetical protein
MQSIVEAICKFIKHVMRCVKHLFGPFLDPYFKIVIQNYSVKRNNQEKTSINLFIHG